MNLENYMLKEWNIYEHDAVRHSLVANKKEWIIENLPKFISKDHFAEDNGFLIKVLKRLEDILRKEDIEVVRHNLVEKNAYVSFHLTCRFPKKPEGSKMNIKSRIVSSAKNEPFKIILIIQVHEEKTLYDILSKFRVSLGGLIPRKEDWISFYTKNQCFRTVCRNCLTLKEIRTYLEGSKRVKKSDKSSYLEFAKSIKSAEKPKKLYKDIIRTEVRGST